MAIRVDLLLEGLYYSGKQTHRINLYCKISEETEKIEVSLKKKIIVEGYRAVSPLIAFSLRTFCCSLLISVNGETYKAD